MKKFIVLSWFMCLAMTAGADELVGNLEYSIENNGTTATVRRVKAEYSGEITVPSTVMINETEYPVTQIYAGALSGRDISKVTIEEGGVTTIGANAFNGCSNLTEVTIPASVTKIGGSAFQGCNKLVKATFASIEALCSILFEGDTSNPLYFAKHLFVGENEVFNLTIPSTVTTVPNYAFQNCSSLTSLVIGEGVTTIGKNAFAGCSAMRNVSIPSTVTTIGGNAFNVGNNANLAGARFASIESLCNIDFTNNTSNPLYTAHHLYIGESEVTEITLPNTENIKPRLFAGASSLTTVSIPAEVKFIGDDAFMNCSKINTVIFSSANQLTTMEYGSGIANPLYYGATPAVTGMALGTLTFTEDIKNDAFTNAKWLTEIIIGPEVNNIGKNAFKSCSNLTTITFQAGSTLDTIDDDAFNGCGALTSILLPETLKSIGTRAFRATKLTTIDIPQNCTTIGSSALEDCTGLNTVTINASITSIPNYIFNRCYNLKNITIPAAIVTIGEGAFQSCSKLTSPPMTDQVTTIGKKAFAGCTGFTILMLSENGQITEIGESAFSGCSNITMVSLPATIRTINNYAFSNCPKLADVYMLKENTVGLIVSKESFGGRQNYITLHVETEESKTAFQGLSVWQDFKEIVVKSNSTLTFYLNEVEVHHISGEAGKPYDMGGNPNYDGNELFTGWWNENGEIIEVPSVMPSSNMNFYGYMAEKWDNEKFQYLLEPAETMNSRNLVRRATIIGNHLTQGDSHVTISGNVVKNPEEEGYTVEAIASEAFLRSEMYEVTLPATIKEIGKGAFKGCANLLIINIPEQVTTISDNIFEGCTALASITIPANIKKIGYQAFCNSGLSEITIPTTITTLGEEIFKDCKSLEKAVFAEGFHLPVPKYTFWNCTRLSDITLQGSMGAIGLNAFQNCESLKSIVLPEGINIISNYAFAGCNQLDQITVNSTNAPQAASYAFSETTYGNATLYVKDAANYTSEPWNKFKNIITQANHQLTYYVNGAVYKQYELMAGSRIVAEQTPSGEEQYDNHEFSGWENLPELMPDEDVDVEGKFKYEIKYYEDAIDETKRLLAEDPFIFLFGDKVTVPAGLHHESMTYTLKGLNPENPDEVVTEYDVADLDKTMPAKDLNVIVSYKNIEKTIDGFKFKFVESDHAEIMSYSGDATTLNIPKEVRFDEDDNELHPITVIQKNAFKGNKKLTSVTIPSSVKVIGDNAFDECSVLKTLTLPSALESIGMQAFAHTALTKVAVPSAPEMGREIFLWCTQLKEISFSETLTYLPNRIFQNCKGLQEVEISDGVKEIGEFAFDGCSDLLHVTLSNSLTTIGAGAFNGCSAITELTLPASVQEIGDMAFYQVFGNKDVLTILGNTLPTAHENTFDQAAYESAVLKTSVASSEETPWGHFFTNSLIEPLEEGSTSIAQCATPVIKYKVNRLELTCDTEGATIVSSVTVNDAQESTSATLPLTKTFTVTAYAKKTGMRRSETVSETFKFEVGDVTGEGEVNVTDIMAIANIILGVQPSNSQNNSRATRVTEEVEPQ